LTLKEQRGHPALVRRHQISRPEPVSQWNLRPVKHCPGRQRDLIATLGTLPASLFNEFVRPPVPALRADEAIGPSTSSQVLLARLFAGELGLELPERLRERRSGHLSNTTYWGMLKQPDNEKLANPHRFRHTFASDMVRAGVSLPALMKLMGHANIQTTLVYIDVTPLDVYQQYARAVAQMVRRAPEISL